MPHTLRLLVPGTVRAAAGTGQITLLGTTDVDPQITALIATPGTVQVNGPAQLSGQLIAGRVALTGGDRARQVRAGPGVSPSPGTRPVGGPGARWGTRVAVTAVAVTAVAVTFAVVASFLGLLYRGDFASGGRSPVAAAIFWGLAAAFAAAPVALLPLIGFRVRRTTALSWALGLGVVWFVVGYFVLA